MREVDVRIVADWFGSVDHWIDQVESVPKRHLDQELLRYIAREPAREGEFRRYFEEQRGEGVMGDGIVATAPLDRTTAASVMAYAAQLGAVRIPMAELQEKLRTLDEFRSRYEGGQYFNAALPDVRQSLDAWCKAAREALKAAECAFEACTKARPEGARTLGITVDGRTLLSMEDVAAFTGSTVDAASKLIREKGLPVHRIGKLKYVPLEDFLRATHEKGGDAELPD